MLKKKILIVVTIVAKKIVIGCDIASWNAASLTLPEPAW